MKRFLLKCFQIKLPVFWRSYLIMRMWIKSWNHSASICACMCVCVWEGKSLGTALAEDVWRKQCSRLNNAIYSGTPKEWEIRWWLNAQKSSRSEKITGGALVLCRFKRRAFSNAQISHTALDNRTMKLSLKIIPSICQYKRLQSILWRTGQANTASRAD